jgi:hypothetical protein
MCLQLKASHLDSFGECDWHGMADEWLGFSMGGNWASVLLLVAIENRYIMIRFEEG